MMKLTRRVQNSKHEERSYVHRFLVTVDKGPNADYSNVMVHDVEVCLAFRLTARCSVIKAWIANRLAWLSNLDALDDDELLIWQLTLDGKPYNFLSRKCWEYLGVKPPISRVAEERILGQLVRTRGIAVEHENREKLSSKGPKDSHEAETTKEPTLERSFRLKIFRG